MINALVLSLKELLLLKGIPCYASASVTVGVKVGHALALGETFCLLTVVFEIIIRDHAEHECLLCTLCICTFQLRGVLRVFLMELCWGVSLFFLM